MRHPSSRSPVGFILIPIAIAAVLIGVGFASCRSDLTYGRPVKGMVIGTGSRTVRTKSKTEEKIALQLSRFSADSLVVKTAAGAGTLSVECVSTRCASLQKEQCVELECSFQDRWFEPDVVTCKMVNLLDCAALAN